MTRVSFHERLTAVQLLRVVLVRNTAFYGTKSIAARGIEWLLGRLGISPGIRKLDFGDVTLAPHIRRRAYEYAETYLDRITLWKWAPEISGILSIDCELIAKKFFFDELYVKYEFLEIALRYAVEHPAETAALYADRQFLEPYQERIEKHFAVRHSSRLLRLEFSSILLLPIFLRYLWARDGIDEKPAFQNQIVCEVDGEKTYEMFNSLFQSCSSRAFVIEQRNIGEFSVARRRELNISSLGLTREDYLYLRTAAYRFIGSCVRHYGDIWLYGGRLFRLFYIFVLGRAETIRGTNNRFVTYEHLITTKAARNEFLRSAGNTSIFVPMNAHATPQYFHSEIFINYDVMCAAGRHTEDLYRKKKAITKMFPPTGSYDNHRGTTRGHDKAKRIARLRAFKGDATVVTIVSPGICDPTYSHELRLMKLARELSKEQGLKVIIRTKPFPPPPKYAAFYETEISEHTSILLTGAEYELFDFLDVTDLFVTSISNAACDLALSGGQVMFIDYMKDPEFFLYWEVVSEAVLTEEESFSAIMEWVRDAESGRSRRRLRRCMDELTSYLGYRFTNFETYRANLLRQLHLESARST